ncbi:MAG: nucleotidyltransferase domain-containing protein [Myxococcales bacterium]|nr:nucleotidyltransferase domain-containing protein [Myxococcales bacterium]
MPEYYEAKHLAAERLTGGRVERVTLPSNREIRHAMLAITRLDRDARLRHLRRLRTVAVEVMEALLRFEPRLIGSVAKGDVHAESDVDLHVFTVDHGALELALLAAGHHAERHERPVVKDGTLRTYVHYRFAVGDVPVELSVYAPAELLVVPISSTDGKPIDRVPLRRARSLLAGT